MVWRSWCPRQKLEEPGETTACREALPSRVGWAEQGSTGSCQEELPTGQGRGEQVTRADGHSLAMSLGSGRGGALWPLADPRPTLQDTAVPSAGSDLSLSKRLTPEVFLALAASLDPEPRHHPAPPDFWGLPGTVQPQRGPSCLASDGRRHSIVLVAEAP